MEYKALKGRQCSLLFGYILSLLSIIASVFSNIYLFVFKNITVIFIFRVGSIFRCFGWFDVR